MKKWEGGEFMNGERDSNPYYRICFKDTDPLGVEKLFPFQVGNNEQLEAIIDSLRQDGKRLDAFVHGIAFASEIRKELHEVSWKSFMQSTRISAFSMVEVDRYHLSLRRAEAAMVEVAEVHEV